jgi:uncharacterized membrane protein affecting hemolysin expression
MKNSNNPHLRETLLCSTLDMPDQPVPELRNECILWLILSAIINIVLITVLIMNLKSPNKTLTQQQEQKLDVAIEKITEAADFIKVDSYDSK